MNARIVQVSSLVMGPVVSVPVKDCELQGNLAHRREARPAGNDHRRHVSEASVSPTGRKHCGRHRAAFSLLPAQNANGNWVKVAQRVPVKISIADPDPTYPLRVGATATVTVSIAK